MTEPYSKDGANVVKNAHDFRTRRIVCTCATEEDARMIVRAIGSEARVAELEAALNAVLRRMEGDTISGYRMWISTVDYDTLDAILTPRDGGGS